MVPDAFHDFFLGEAGASGALVGLLFVAISVRPDRVIGGQAQVLGQARASAALTALLTPLTLSLLGLFPGADMGIPAIVVGFAGLLFVAATIRRFFSVPKEHRESARGLISLGAFTLDLGIVLGYGIVSLIHPSDIDPINAIAAASVAAMLLGVDQAWALIGGRGRGRFTSLVDLVKGADDVPGAPPGDKPVKASRP